MNRGAFGLQLLAVAIAGMGCVGPLVPVVDLDEESTRRLRSEVAVLEAPDLEQAAYERLSEIEAISCMNKIWDPPASAENAIDQLRYKAQCVGANALVDVRCEKPESTSLVKNCWSSVTCRGVAINLRPLPAKSD